MRSIATDVARGVVCVCCAKTAEPIKIRFGFRLMWACVKWGVKSPPREWALSRGDVPTHLCGVAVSYMRQRTLQQSCPRLADVAEECIRGREEQRCGLLLNKKHLRNVGPIRYCEPPLHCQSPGVASRTPAIAVAIAGVVHDNNNNDNA